jgi:hypothetical protein
MLKFESERLAAAGASGRKPERLEGETMKRKKLLLHRETLHSLSRRHLAQVAGGGETFEVISGCACTDGCDSQGCGSAGCGGSAAGCSDDTCTCVDPPSFCFC